MPSYDQSSSRLYGFYDDYDIYDDLFCDPDYVEQWIDKLLDRLDKEYPNGSAFADDWELWDTLFLLTDELDEDGEPKNLFESMTATEAAKAIETKFALFDFMNEYKLSQAECGGGDRPDILNFRYSK